MGIQKPTLIDVRWEPNVADQVDPDPTKKDLGWVVNEKPPSQYFNWMMNRYYLWNKWFDERMVDAGGDTGKFGLKDPENVSGVPDITISDGRIGINTTSPSTNSRLHIKEITASTNLIVQLEANGANSFNFKDDTGAVNEKEGRAIWEDGNLYIDQLNDGGALKKRKLSITSSGYFDFNDGVITITKPSLAANKKKWGFTQVTDAILIEPLEDNNTSRAELIKIAYDDTDANTLLDPTKTGLISLFQISSDSMHASFGKFVGNTTPDTDINNASDYSKRHALNAVIAWGHINTAVASSSIKYGISTITPGALGVVAITFSQTLSSSDYVVLATAIDNGTGNSLTTQVVSNDPGGFVIKLRKDNGDDIAGSFHFVVIGTGN